MRSQQPLIDAASVVQWSVERGNSQGYAGIVLAESEVVVWWKGVPAAPVAAAVEQARKIAAIRVAAAAHSRAELKAAAAGIRNYLRTHPDSPYHSLEIAYDGSRLTLLADLHAILPASLPAEMKAPRQVPLTVLKRQRPATPQAPAEVPATRVQTETVGTAGYLSKPWNGRMHDDVPFYGGGRIVNMDNRTRCTAGFSVTVGGANYMLTAGHCGRPWGEWYNGNLGVYFGVGRHEHVAYDLLLISANVGPAIWDGGVDFNEFVKGVAGWGWVFSGEWLCTSGSYTGAQCHNVVTGGFTDTFCGRDAYGHYECYYDLITAHHAYGQVAFRPGDDGGPVFGLADADRVIAKGTMTTWFGGTGVMFQDFATAWRAFGVTPLIG